VSRTTDIPRQTVVGEFRVRRRRNFVAPHDERFRDWIEIPDGMEMPPAGGTADRIGARGVEVAGPQDLDGMMVNVEILEPPEHNAPGVGRVIEILGRPDDFGVDVEMVIRKFRIPHRFPAAVLEEAQDIVAARGPTPEAGRRDFRGFDIVTIDGETARDFDDAVWVDRLADGHFVLHVHIADVSHYVRPDSAIDQEARLRGTSVYFPDRAVPMLPLELSTDLCSLNPGVDRLVLSVLLEIDHGGDVVGQEFTRGIIRSIERMTYTNVQLALDGDAGVCTRYARLVERFQCMQELAHILNRKRTRRGSIDFDLPEPLIEFDEWGEMTGVRRAPRNMAHRIIEEFMLAANEAVASHLSHLEIESLYRIHEPPDPERVVEFEEIAAQFGYTLGIGALPAKRFPMVRRMRDGRKERRDLVLPDATLTVSPRQYQRLIAKVGGKAEERILNYLMLRSLKQARYSERNLGHFALASPIYTHFTSPIRRYPDLIVHRVLSRLLRFGSPPGPYGKDELHAMAEESSLAERRAAEAERELVEWKKAKFMLQHVGDEFPALIVNTARFGFFVELQEYFVEGLVRIDTLPGGGRYSFQENTHRIVDPRSRRAFALGDRVEVRLDRVDAMAHKLQFSVVERAGPRPRGRERRLR
jgi:ribonuclease R